MKQFGFGLSIAMAIAALGSGAAGAQDGNGDYARAEALLDADGDEQGAYGAFRAACEAGHAQGCFRAGDLLTILSETEEEDAEAFELIVRSCDLGFGPGCRNAGDDYSFEDGKDPEALALFVRGCDLDDAISCKQAGFMHHTGRGVAKYDYVVGREFYDRACTLGDPAGCHAAGVTVISEQGRRGYPLARSFFERGLALEPGHPDSKQALEQIAGF